MNIFLYGSIINMEKIVHEYEDFANTWHKISLDQTKNIQVKEETITISNYTLNYICNEYNQIISLKIKDQNIIIYYDPVHKLIVFNENKKLSSQLTYNPMKIFVDKEKKILEIEINYYYRLKIDFEYNNIEDTHKQENLEINPDGEIENSDKNSEIEGSDQENEIEESDESSAIDESNQDNEIEESDESSAIDESNQDSEEIQQENGQDHSIDVNEENEIEGQQDTIIDIKQKEGDIDQKNLIEIKPEEVIAINPEKLIYTDFNDNVNYIGRVINNDNPQCFLEIEKLKLTLQSKQ